MYREGERKSASERTPKKTESWTKRGKRGGEEEKNEKLKEQVREILGKSGTRILFSFWCVWFLCYSHSQLGTTASSFIARSWLFIQLELLEAWLLTRSKSSLISALFIAVVLVVIDRVEALRSPPNQTWPSISWVNRRSSGLTRINERSNERAFKEIVRGMSGRHRPIFMNRPTRVRSQNG